MGGGTWAEISADVQNYEVAERCKEKRVIYGEYERNFAFVEARSDNELNAKLR